MRFYRQGLFFTLFIIVQNTTLAQQPVPQDTIPRYFEGLYIGTGLGTQHIRATILINDTFISSAQSRLVVDLVLGHRWQFINDRVTFSFEVHAGVLNGNQESNSIDFPNINFQFTNKSQVGLGYDLGYVVDIKRKLLIFLYARQVRRTFQISALEQSGTVPLGSESIVTFRYGLGLAYHVRPRFNAQLKFGSFANDLLKDFPRINRPEASIGLVYQF